LVSEPFLGGETAIVDFSVLDGTARESSTRAVPEILVFGGKEGEVWVGLHAGEWNIDIDCSDRWTAFELAFDDERSDNGANSFYGIRSFVRKSVDLR